MDTFGLENESRKRQTERAGDPSQDRNSRTAVPEFNERNVNSAYFGGESKLLLS